jgi:hypothetical protein
VENAMLARIAGTVLLSAIVFVVVTMLVSLGVLWATGGVARGVLLGLISGTAAAFTIGAVGTAVGDQGNVLGTTASDPVATGVAEHDICDEASNTT